MKKTFISAGIAAIGVLSLHADYAPDITAMDASKIWSVSGTLRGFYDDNYNTTPHKVGSAGFEFSPSFDLIMPLQQTELGLRYTYGLYYYQKRAEQGSSPIDQTHDVDLWVDHAFSERLEAKVQDSFIVGQDPQLSATPTSTPYRVQGNYLNNIGIITLHTELSMLFSADLGFQNNWLYYTEHGTTEAGLLNGSQAASDAGLLNNINQNIYLNFNYDFRPDLTFLIGYQFGVTAYTGNEPIALGPDLASGQQYFFSDYRNQYSHFLYLGGQYAATANLSMSVQAGFQYSDNYNLPSYDPQSASSFDPYANVAATYTYLPGDYIQLGFTQSQNPTSEATPTSNHEITLYQESSVLYASVNHQITPYLLGSVIGHYQYSKFVGGALNNGSQNWYSFGVNLSYTFTPHLSAEVGYNFNDLVTDAPGENYNQNIEYVGVTGTY